MYKKFKNILLAASILTSIFGLVPETQAAPIQVVISTSAQTIYGTKTFNDWLITGANAKIGFGTATPLTLLDVNGAATIRGQVTTTSTITIRADNEGLALKDPDVAHGITGLLATDSYAAFYPHSGTNGGLKVLALSDANATALEIEGIIGSADPTDTTEAIAIVGSKSDGATGRADLGASETVLEIKNNATVLTTVLGGGNVGIGTVPSTKFHVSAGTVLIDGANAALTLGSTSMGNNAVILALAGSARQSHVCFGSNGVGCNSYIGQTGAAGDLTNDSVTADMVVRTNGAIRFTADNGAESQLRVKNDAVEVSSTAFVINGTGSSASIGSVLTVGGASTFQSTVTFQALIGGKAHLGGLGVTGSFTLSGSSATFRQLANGTTSAMFDVPNAVGNTWQGYTTANGANKLGNLGVGAGGLIEMDVTGAGGYYIVGGNVGVGTASPQYKMDVSSGRVNVQGTDAEVSIISDNGGTLTLQRTNPSFLATWKLIPSLSDQGDIGIRDAAQSKTRLLIDSAGRVGIGDNISRAGAALEVASGTFVVNGTGASITVGIAGEPTFRGIRTNSTDALLRIQAVDNAGNIDGEFNYGTIRSDTIGLAVGGVLKIFADADEASITNPLTMDASTLTIHGIGATAGLGLRGDANRSAIIDFGANAQSLGGASIGEAGGAGAGVTGAAQNDFFIASRNGNELIFSADGGNSIDAILSDSRGFNVFEQFTAQGSSITSKGFSSTTVPALTVRNEEASATINTPVAKFYGNTTGEAVYVIDDGALFAMKIAARNDANTLPAPLQVIASTLTIGSQTGGNVEVSGRLRLYARTKAQIDVLAPQLGDTVVCSDCAVPYDICVATGTARSGFRATLNSAINTTIPGTLVNKGCGTGE